MHSENYPSEATPRGRISVIMPVWRESAALSSALATFRSASDVAEVIVSFAEGTSEAMRFASESGAICLDVGNPNRGRQLDLGAQRATADWLLFHHVDTFITLEHLRNLSAINPASGIVGGAFYRQFDERHPKLRFLEGVERWHNRSFGALYGDQSIFARREVFQAIGGFRGLPLMEDVDFSLRLRRAGKIRLLDPPLGSSARKHLAQGPWRTTFRNASLLLLYHLGVSPAWLHARYYRRGASSERDSTDYLIRGPGPQRSEPKPDALM
jgi:rSAM/selenodomain-associated transferase 2